jgi:hypothetical protein
LFIYIAIYMAMSTPSVSISAVQMPIPERVRGLPGRELGDSAYPFDALEVNWHFQVANRSPATVRQAIQRYYLRNGRSKRFVQRMDGDGNPTVWRTK